MLHDRARDRRRTPHCHPTTTRPIRNLKANRPWSRKTSNFSDRGGEQAEYLRVGSRTTSDDRPGPTFRVWRLTQGSEGNVRQRSAGVIRAGGTLVTVVGPPEARPTDGLAVDFVVESDRAQLREIVQRVRDGRLRTNIGTVATLDDAVDALNPTERRNGKTIIRIRR